ncbi:MAG: DUF2268 domain-containing putative Zn-dependent protease [Shewanella sp.]
MTIKVTLLNSSGKLSRLSAPLHSAIDKTLTRVAEFIELFEIDITISPFQQGEESPSGLGGYALSEHRVELLVDCSRDDIERVIEAELMDVLAHELHHSVRMRFHLSSNTLADQLIMEGLACHFEHTVTNGKPSSLFKDLQNYDWRIGLQQMSHLLDSTDFSLTKLFLGSHPEVFPKYAGYWIGFNLVTEYVAHHSVTDADIVGLDTTSFFAQKSQS